MATFSSNGLDELILSLEEVAQLPDSVKDEILNAQADVVVQAQRQKARAYGVHRTGLTVEKIGKGKPKTTKDGRVICLAGQDSLFERLLTVMDDPILHKPEYRDHDTRLMPEHYDIINAAVEREIAKRTGDEWDEIFDRIGVPGGKIKDLGDVMASPATYTRNTTVKLEVPGLGPVTFPGTPLYFSDEELGFDRAPDLGEHNREIYCGLLGRTEEELNQLLENKDI